MASASSRAATSGWITGRSKSASASAMSACRRAAEASRALALRFEVNLPAGDLGPQQQVELLERILDVTDHRELGRVGAARSLPSTESW